MVIMAARLLQNKNDYHLIKNVTIPADGAFKQLNSSCQAPATFQL